MIEQQSGSTTTSLKFDNNGNETNDGTYLYSYDAFNRLEMVTREAGGAVVAVYAYDTGNRRISKVVTNSGSLDGTTDSYYDGWQDIEERDGGGALVQQYVFGANIDEPLVLDRNLGGGGTATGPGDQRLFYNQDILYSVYALTDVSGNLVEAYQYDAYGRQTVFGPGPGGTVTFGAGAVILASGISAVGNPFTFTGQRLDAETALMYYENRYYSTLTGRFISRDPKGYAAGINLYEYGNDNPIVYRDPLGLDGVEGPPTEGEGGGEGEGEGGADPLSEGNSPIDWRLNDEWMAEEADLAESMRQQVPPSSEPGPGMEPVGPDEYMPGETESLWNRLSDVEDLPRGPGAPPGTEGVMPEANDVGLIAEPPEPPYVPGEDLALENQLSGVPKLTGGPGRLGAPGGAGAPEGIGQAGLGLAALGGGIGGISSAASGQTLPQAIVTGTEQSAVAGAVTAGGTLLGGATATTALVAGGTVAGVTAAGFAAGYAGYEAGTAIVNTSVGQSVVNAVGDALGAAYYHLTSWW